MFKKGAPALSALAPPPPDPDFMRREREIQTVCDGLKEGQPVLLWGLPGVGKSAIARAVAHESAVQKHFGGRILWLNAYSASLDSLCSTILRQMGFAEALKNMPTPDEKASVLRGALKQAGVTVLFVLDQADSSPGAGQFCRDVSPQTLVTSQDKILGLPPLKVETFKGQKVLAQQLIQANAHVTLTGAERRLLPTVARQCGYLPLALKMAGSQLTEGYRLADLSRDLEERGVSPLADPVNPQVSVGATFDIAYGRLAPTPRLQRLFSAFGAFNILEDSVERDAVLSACGEGGPHDLGALEERSLVAAATGKKGRYTMHSLLWRYACGKLGDDPAPRARALDYFTKLAEKHRKARWQDYREMDAALPHVFFLLRWAREKADRDVSLKGVVLLNVIPEFLDRRGYWEEWVEWGQWALDTARVAGNKVLTGLSAHLLAIALQQRGDMAGARTLYGESLALSRELGDKGGTASTLHQMGKLAQDQGDYTEARKLYGESLKIKRELGDKSGIANSLGQMGNLAQDQGDYREARKLYEEVVALSRELGDKRKVAVTLHNLGMLAPVEGDYAGARALYDESLGIKRELGDKNGIAVTLHQLGRLAQAQGDYAGARTLYDESLKLKREMGSKSGIAVTLHQLGILAQVQGDHAGARKLYDESMALERELGNKSGIANSQGQLGVLAELEGRPKEAADYYRRALAIFEELHLPNAEKARKALARVVGGQGGSMGAPGKGKT